MSVIGGGGAATLAGGTKLSTSLEQDVYKVAEKKRGEADRMRFELNAALKDLYALQSQVMVLERENSVIDSQLQRNVLKEKEIASASSRRTIPGAPSDKPARSLLTSGGLMEAIYQTEGIKKLVDDLEGIKAETVEIQCRGQSYEHMRSRLADEVVECRRNARQLQDRVQEERGRNGDLHRKEMEMLRQVATAQNRFAELKKDVENQTSKLKTDIKERQAFVKKKRELNAYLESQLNASTSPVMMATARSTATVSDDASSDRKRVAAQMLSAKSLKQRLSRAITDAEGEESRYLDALRAMGLPTPSNPAPEPSLEVGSRVLGASASLSRLPSSPAKTATASPFNAVNTTPRASLDTDFLVEACLHQDSVRKMLLGRLSAEEARMREMQLQSAALRAPMRSNQRASPVHTMRAVTPAGSPASSIRSATAAGSPSSPAEEVGSIVLPEASTHIVRPDSAGGYRPSNRDLADRDKAVADFEKQLQLLQGENEFLMSTVMPLRTGLAGMARKMLGTTCTLADVNETITVLNRLCAKCAAIVDEIRKAIALADPDGHNMADWTTLQSEEIAEALNEAKRLSPTSLKNKAAAKAAASHEALSPYMSPYNIRVPAGRTAVLKNSYALKMINEDVGHGSVGSDDDDGQSRASSEADEEKDVLNRGELKKMSQKLLRYRKRQDSVVSGKPLAAGEHAPLEAVPPATRSQMLRNLSRARKR